jgi:hypothetical protein
MPKFVELDCQETKLVAGGAVAVRKGGPLQEVVHLFVTGLEKHFGITEMKRF